MYFADIDSSVVGIYAAGIAPEVPLFLGEPCAPAFQRNQGGASVRARPIMTGNASGSKMVFAPGSDFYFLGEGHPSNKKS
jgi:hypothetical protein